MWSATRTPRCSRRQALRWQCPLVKVARQLPGRQALNRLGQPARRAEHSIAGPLSGGVRSAPARHQDKMGKPAAEAGKEQPGHRLHGQIRNLLAANIGRERMGNDVERHHDEALGRGTAIRRASVALRSHNSAAVAGRAQPGSGTDIGKEKIQR